MEQANTDTAEDVEQQGVPDRWRVSTGDHQQEYFGLHHIVAVILDKTFSQNQNRSSWSDWKAVETISSSSLT